MNKYTFLGNGKNKDFYFTFPFFTKADIIVKINGAETTGYGVFCIQGTSNNDFPFTGGHIHFATAPKVTDIITIERKLQYNRLIDYQPTEKLNPTTVNQDMNYFFELLKDIKSDLTGLAQTYSEFTDIPSTQTLLEKINAVTDEIDTVTNQIEDLGDITTIRTNITNLGTSITNLTNSLNTLTSTVGTHTTDIGTLQTSVTGLVQNPKITVPDYAHGEDRNWNTEYTATENGLLVFCGVCNSNSSGIYVVINGINLFRATNGANMGPSWIGGDHQGCFGATIPVAVGDTYKLCGGVSNQKLIFFPYK